jgi:hypothetical protein
MAKKPTLKDITDLLNAIEDYEIKREIQWIGSNGRHLYAILDDENEITIKTE